MEQDKEILVASLEERLNYLVRQYRSSPPDDALKLEKRIKKLSQEFLVLTSKNYCWESKDYIMSREKIREYNNGMVI